jgi:RNA polymerase sigma-70 factor (ECF subfamily)
MQLKEFQNLILLIKDRIYRMSYTILLNEEDARDITQEVLLKLWENKNEIQKVFNLEAYAIVMAKNMCFHFLKNQKKLTDSKNIFSQTDMITRQNHDEKEALNILLKSLEFVSAEHRLVFEMKTIEGYSYDEIAEVTGLSFDNLRKIVSRTRKKISKHLQEQYSYGRD